LLGSCNETDFISRLLVGLAAVRAFPETDPARHTMVQSVPVDVTAAALCDLCAPRGPRRGEVLHVVSGAPPQPMASLRQALLARPDSSGGAAAGWGSRWGSSPGGVGGK